MEKLIEQAFSVSRLHLAESLPRRWSHVLGCADRARIAADALLDEVDSITLVSAAVLHDIGYAPSIARTGMHALDGARFLQQIEITDRVCALVAHHSCAYLEAELRGLSAELGVWSDEQSVLRDALWWADMTTTPDGGVTTVHDRIAEIRERYGPKDLVSFFIKQASRELIAAVERTEERLRMAGIDYAVK
ncbi:HD domain-containing protein [Lentzea fradiae]|uniref:HD domain-containing protein n=1 Tax=Lentzea fradiae TaxID=200378 RepID=UPI000B7DC782|nr:HD domain-containing protein [Lentzea fradiae]